MTDKTLAQFDKSHAAAVEFAATHFEQYGLSHLQIGHPWTGVTLADALRAFTPSHVAPNAEPFVPLHGKPPAWLILFDDRDKPVELFSGAGAEEGAYRRFAEASTNWNCHLFSNVEAPQDTPRGALGCPTASPTTASASTPSTTQRSDCPLENCEKIGRCEFPQDCDAPSSTTPQKTGETPLTDSAALWLMAEGPLPAGWKCPPGQEADIRQFDHELLGPCTEWKVVTAAIARRLERAASTPSARRRMCSCGAEAGEYHRTGCGYEGVFNG